LPVRRVPVLAPTGCSRPQPAGPGPRPMPGGAGERGGCRQRTSRRSAGSDRTGLTRANAARRVARTHPRPHAPAGSPARPPPGAARDGRLSCASARRGPRMPAAPSLEPATMPVLLLPALLLVMVLVWALLLPVALWQRYRRGRARRRATPWLVRANAWALLAS